ncbi:hypothetical protein M9194_19605 [Vibrio sp. S4M6]|uniref:hypothetical protein n=1 Tax=Vibrio sinus TaxID=2946865 RepID=UPI00202A01F0|nr:hypothetical protein [Vibrio sinus]MCL9783634.1 hypothetical protein [Vibrio sinus]
MSIDNQTQVKVHQKMTVTSLSLDKDELKQFCDILQQRANSAAEIEARLFLKNENQTEEVYEENKATLKSSFKLKVTIAGADGDQHWGTIEEVFNSPNFPESVKSLYIESDLTLRVNHNYHPHNSFKVFLDFSKPKIFDFSFMPNTETPNESMIEVQGYDSTWVNGVFSELKSFIDKRASKLSIVHNHSVYDVLVWILGFPLAFWVCSKFSVPIEVSFGSNNIYLSGALYLYSFVITLFLFRVLFHYLRWVCPLVEYQNKKNSMLVHRGSLLALTTGWVGSFIYDVAQWILEV